MGPPDQPLVPEQRERRRPRQEEQLRAGRRRLALLLAAILALTVTVVALAGGGRGDGTHYARAKHAAAATGPAQPVNLTVEANGDLLIHSPVWERALTLGGGRRYDFTPLLSEVRPWIAGADLAICHVETPMGPGPPRGYPVFNTPPDLATSIHAEGWRICDTASNHSLDGGQAGVDSTGQALSAAGVLHTGSFPSAAAQGQTLMVTVKGIRIAFMAYTEMTNGEPLPHPWSVNLASAPRILADARLARQRGAQVVIVNLHWGEEYQQTPSLFQRRLANSLTRSPNITAVIGQHVHVVQPIQRVNGKLVVFGEGNLLSNQTAACCPVPTQDGILALLRIVVDRSGARVARIDYVPVWVRHPDFEVVPAGAGVRSDPADAAELRASYRRTVAVVGRGPNFGPVPAQQP